MGGLREELQETREKLAELYKAFYELSLVKPEEQSMVEIERTKNRDYYLTIQLLQAQNRELWNELGVIKRAAAQLGSSRT